MKQFFVAAAVVLSCACVTLPSTPPPIVVVRPPVATPPPAPTAPAIHADGGRFVDASGHDWKWKFATDFLLFKKYLDHQDIAPILDQRQAAGANGVRVFAMCQNITHFAPVDYAQGNLWYWDGLVEFVDMLAARGLYVEITVFADAQLVMPGDGAQLAHWAGFARVADKPNVFIELVNENTHAGNTINARIFPRLAGAALQAHGSNQTDEHPVDPAWDYVTYHARRDAPPDARGATNYAATVFESGFPLQRPEVADEGVKTTNAAFAALAGAYANVHNGGTFHSQSGVASDFWTADELTAAKAFFGAIR